MSLPEIIQADAAKITSDFAGTFGYEYVPRGTDPPGTAIAFVYVSTGPKRPVGPDVARHGMARAPHRQARLSVMLPRLREDETIAVGADVGDDGGIKTLESGDRIKVPGYAVGQPDTAEVYLTITGGIDSPTRSGHWWAEVTL